MKEITLFNTTIRNDADGRFCLNDLHKAAIQSGNAKESQKPSEFLRNAGVVAFIDALDLEAHPISVIKGRGITASYGVREVFFAYADWLLGHKFKINIIKHLNDLSIIQEALNNFDVPDDLPDMYVYAIRESETGRIKLGISKHPEERLKQLQIGNSQKLELVAYKKAENRFKDEKLAHSDNQDKRIRGEWFSSEAVNSFRDGVM